MRILLVTGVYPPAIGGPAKQVYDLARELHNNGHTVTVLTFGANNAVEDQSGIKIYTLKRKVFILARPIKFWHLRKMLKKIAAQGLPDVVQVNSVRLFGYFAARYFRQRGVPTLIKYAGDLVYETINSDNLRVIEVGDVYKFSFSARCLAWLQKRILNSFTRIWAQSQYQRDVLVKYLKLDPERITVMPNYIDIQPYLIGEELLRPQLPDMKPRPIILTTSRLVPWKNIEAQMHVMARLKEISTSTFLLYIVGGGIPLVQERLKTLTRSLNLVNEIKILPQVSPSEIHRYFRSARAYLSTSLYEPFGIVFIEAMAAGVPIVALDAGAIPEIVNENVGFVVQRGAHYIDRLAHRLKIIIENDEVKEFFATNGPREAERYDIKKHVGEFIKLYTYLVSKKHG